MSESAKRKRRRRGGRGPGLFTRFLNAVEFLGNLLPHPVTLFAVLALLILLVSGMAEMLDWQVEDPRPAVFGAAPRTA